VSPHLTVVDIQTYLFEHGWRRQPQTWHEASIWSHGDGYEVLVPPRDDMADTDLRVREVLAVLTAVERRPAEEISGDIDAPFADLQLYRTFPDDLPSGFTSLSAGLRGLHGVREIVRAAARTVVEGPLPMFPRGAPRVVDELLQDVQLGPGRPGSYVFTVRVPLDRSPVSRAVTRQVYEAVTAVRSATSRSTERDLTPFDEMVTAGVSANLCEALSGLSGRRQEEPFDITFRWGRGLPSDLPPDMVRFDTGMGRVIRAAAAHLREVGVSGDGVVTGTVESLHDRPEGDDRWRIRIRGDFSTQGEHGIGRAVWVRLNSQIPYDRAIAAHRMRQRVRARGDLSSLQGRVELVVDDNDFDILQEEE
jgi:hypothetical protein